MSGDDDDKPQETKETGEQKIETEQAGLVDTLLGNSDETGAKTDATGRPVKVIKPND
jgi:hypothetical protein